MTEDIWERIISLVEREVAPPKTLVLTRETDLVEDLGLSGDDADDFMGKYAEEFAVDAGDFDFSAYFPPEGFDPIGIFGRLISGSAKKNAIQPLTLGMLEKAAQNGVWKTEELA